MIAPRALVGGALVGDDLVRLAYLDESGIGPIADEPFTVTAGVIVNADRQFKLLEKYLSEMADQYFPGQPDKFFHAKDIWHGSRDFSRQKFPDKWPRRMILLEICELVKKFDLPVVWGYMDRAVFHADHPEFGPKDAITATLAMSAFQAMVGIEHYMRRFKSDLAMVTYENNETSKKIIRAVHNYWKLPHDADLMNFPEYRKYLPF